ncbi:MAG: carboxypeptidase regulatory-like protein [Planctomycetaceae bacterium]|nr:carboxypeptidase regulatory-like protein [Planctomycetaceae bacterium]
MSNLTRVVPSGLLLSLLFVVAACGKSGPPLASVSGVVTYQDKPVVYAQVVLMSIEKYDGRTWPASAETDEDGRYVLETPGVGNGALVGKHTVSITKRGPSRGAAPGSPAVGNESRPEMQAYMLPGPALIPERYFSPVTSGLEAEVKPGSNTFDFKLKD